MTKTNTEVLEDLIAVSDTIEDLWAAEGSDQIAYELHDALESVRRAVRMVRERRE